MAFLPSFWNKSSRNSQKKSPERKRTVPSHQPRRLRIEGLENREMLATVVESHAALALHSTSLIITGTGFSPIVANNTITFTGGQGSTPTGTVISATNDTLIVEFASNQLSKTGDLLIDLTVQGDPITVDDVAVARIVPTITANTTNVNLGNLENFVIAGEGFSTTAAKNLVYFYDANDNLLNVGGTAATSAAADSLTLDISGFALLPGGSLSAVVVVVVGDDPDPLVDPTSVKTQVGTVVPTLADGTNTGLPIHGGAGEITITGTGFDTTKENNQVYFDNGAVGIVTAATATELTVSFTADGGSMPTTIGALHAFVMVNGVASSLQTVATVTPVVANDAQNVASNATTMVIKGYGFSLTPASNELVFYSDLVGTVSGAGHVTAVTEGAGGLMTLTVAIDTARTGLGNWYVIVTTDGVASAADTADATQVAVVGPGITRSTTNMVSGTTSITINGAGFNGTTDTVVFYSDDGGQHQVSTGTITGGDATHLVVDFDTPPVAVGNLYVQVTNGSASPVVQVATIIPVVTATATAVGAPDPAVTPTVTVTVTGSGFNNAATKMVTLTNGGRTYTFTAGQVTVNSATELTVDLSTLGLVAGDLKAVVVMNGYSTGAPVTVATIIPTITDTSAAQTVRMNATTLTVKGFGFSTDPAKNTVGLYSSAAKAPSGFTNITVTSVSVNAGTGEMTLTVTVEGAATFTGDLYADVTVDGVVTSSATQTVAQVAPVVTANMTTIAIGAETLTITGAGFADGTTVAFTGGGGNVTGTGVVGGGGTTLTVTFDEGFEPSANGPLYAIVTSNGVASESVQVATIGPVVINNAGSRIAADATSVTIYGSGFSDTDAENTVIFSNGAVGRVTDATTTQITVTFDVSPTTAGELSATVLVNSGGTVVSSSTVAVATVTPVISTSAANLAANATTVTIAGRGFVPGSTTVTFYSNAAGTSVVYAGSTVVVGSSTSTSLVVSLAGVSAGGDLYAKVTVAGVPASSVVKVASVVPVVNFSSVSQNATANSIVIHGSGFSAVASQNTVVFNNGALGYVSAAAADQLTVTFLTKPTAGSLTATVTTNGKSSLTIQVATVKPVVTAGATPLTVNDSTFTLYGTGFSAVTANDKVYFYTSADPTTPAAVGSVTAATATSLTVSFIAAGCQKPTAAGDLYASVTVNSISSGTPVKVAVVGLSVERKTDNLDIDAASITISGRGFSTAAGANDISFYNENGVLYGTVEDVTATDANTLTVDLSTITPSLAVGALKVVVTSNGEPSGSAVQVATLIPVVTSATTSIAITANTMTIAGDGFDLVTPANNTVAFFDDAAGEVASAVTGTITGVDGSDLIVTFTNKPTTLGNLYAKVTTTGATSSVKQVGTVVPVVTVSQATVAANATAMVINGFGFGTQGQNSVRLTNADGSVVYGTISGADVTVSLNGTRLTVDISDTLTNALIAGNLKAVVTVGSGEDAPASESTQVGIVAPTVTTHATALLADAGTLTIDGHGFGAQGQNSVTLTNSDGTVTYGTISGANVVVDEDGIELTVTLDPATYHLIAGSLKAVVTSNGVASGTAIQVATVNPVVTADPTKALSTNDATITIAGFGFASTTSGNSVVFYDNPEGTGDPAAAGIVSSAAADGTSITVTFTTRPSALGNLYAKVISNTRESTIVQVGQVKPVVTAGTGTVPLNRQIVINGFGFGAQGQNSVRLTNADGSVVYGTISGANVTVNGPKTQLTLTIPEAFNLIGGALMASVTVGEGETAITSETVQVATVSLGITSSDASFGIDNTTDLTITGTGFDTTDDGSHNTVKFYLQDGVTLVATGTVTAATSTTLTVTIPPDTELSLGVLKAVVTVGGQDTAATQVATIVPVVNEDTENPIDANTTTVTISGYGFDAVTRTNNQVTFNRGAVGVVTQAEAGENGLVTLTVTFTTKPTSVGVLTAIVTVNGVASAAAVQVATVSPVVNENMTSVLASANTITISGYGFDATDNGSHNTVVFNHGAIGAVTGATTGANGLVTLTVSFTGEGGHRPAGGVLTAVVTTNGASSGAAVQVATVTPVVTETTTSVGFNATTVTITGFGFDTTPGSIGVNNTVAFVGGAVGTVTAVNAAGTQLTVTFSANPPAVGNLTASVTTNGQTSGAAKQVATIVPVVTSSTSSLEINANTMTISGYGFSTTASENTIEFNKGAIGAVTNAVEGENGIVTLTVSFTAEGCQKPTSVGDLTAIVTTNGVASAAAVQVATVIPFVQPSVSVASASTTTLHITGFGFSATEAENSVVFYTNGVISAVGTITDATTTTLDVTFTSGPIAGNLMAVVTVNGVSSGEAVQVRTVTPVVTTPAPLPVLASNANRLTIDGYGFDPVASHNTVILKVGSTTISGTVTSATSTQLTVTLSGTLPTSGTMTAQVRTNNQLSGTAVNVATMTTSQTKPTVSTRTTALAADATEVVIYGTGFNTTAARNTVVFSSGATGHVTAATATQLTVAFDTLPTAGNLTAIVYAAGVASGTTGVQVAKVTPVVTESTASLDANSATMTITGIGFSATPGNNLVAFNNGATGAVTSVSDPDEDGKRTLTVTFAIRPTTVGSLMATVTTNTTGVGTATQVATIRPSVTESTAALGITSDTLYIDGYGFSTTAGNNLVAFNMEGVTGTVESATATRLTVHLTGLPTTLGTLTAIVTTGGQSSTSKQVATVAPVVTSSTANLAYNAATMTIDGAGFDTTAGHNTVTFNNGVTGTVTDVNETGTQLTVTFAEGVDLTAGNLTAIVSVNGIASGATGVQVATVKPVVTTSAADLLANAATMTITGAGFSATPGNNLVVFNNGAVGAVTDVNEDRTELTVTFSVKPTTAGSLTVTVTTNEVAHGETPVEVATVKPVVTLSTTALGINANEIVIHGFGFSATAEDNEVTFNGVAAGHVTVATATSLTVVFDTHPAALGSLTAVVTVNELSSGAAVQVATVAPAVTSSTADLAYDAATMTIDGFGFDTTAGHNTVTFNNGVTGTVTDVNEAGTQLTVTFAEGVNLTAGNLTAIVSVNGIASGATGVQVATVRPAVTSSEANLNANVATITINGFGFSTTKENNTVAFYANGVACGTGTVQTATAIQLVVQFSTPPTAGDLTAIVTTNGAAGTETQVATVKPVVTTSAANVLATATTMTIDGFGFDATAGNNTVVFNDGAIGTVTGVNEARTQLTVTFSTKPTTAGSLTAVVTVNSQSSGDPVEVATVKPVITSSTASVGYNATTLTINGFGFSTTPGNNTVTFSTLGVTGTVTSATATRLTVTIAGTNAVGVLNASVSVGGVSSGSAVQVATIVPVVTSSTVSIAKGAPTMYITGYGFNATPGQNAVTFNLGVAGTVTGVSGLDGQGRRTLTVTFTSTGKPNTLGVLTASVTTSSRSSGAAVQVATVGPAVTTSTANIALNAASITINGSGFSSSYSYNRVVFYTDASMTHIAAEGTVVSGSTATRLTVNFTVRPTIACNLYAVVGTKLNSVGAFYDGVPTQVATVLGPTITANTTTTREIVLGETTSITIAGSGFDPTQAAGEHPYDTYNTVVFYSNAACTQQVAGTVVVSSVAAGGTSMTVLFTPDDPMDGPLYAKITTNGKISAGVQVLQRLTVTEPEG